MCEIIEIGGHKAFICNGHATDHECNSDDGIILLSGGERVAATEYNEELYRDQIVGGSVACSICGRAAIDEAMWI